MESKISKSTSKSSKLMAMIALQTKKTTAKITVFFFCLNLRWFEGFNWEGLRKGTLTPPIIPDVSQNMHQFKIACQCRLDFLY